MPRSVELKTRFCFQLLELIKTFISSEHASITTLYIDIGLGRVIDITGSCFRVEPSVSVFMESAVMGGSLPVANVQDLAAKKLEMIPQRYVRPELKNESVVEEQVEIPVVDFSKLNIPQFSDSEMAKLHSACEDWGFFQLVNHGVSEEVTESMKIEVGKFFQLPLEEKMACSQLPHTIEGYGQAFVLSEEQKLDWGDMLFIITQPTTIRSFRYWPACPDTFRETLDKYSRELQGLAIRLLGFIAENLGIDANKLSSMFEEGVQGVRMNYYPPCPQANQVLGISPHSDAVALTLLLQANEIQGLQIRKNATWVPVIPIPGAFIVNVGDIVEILSNGEYKSIEHRAVVNTDKERLSIAAFHSPNLNSHVGPLQVLAKGEEKYKSVSHEEYSKLTVASKLDGKKLLDSMKTSV